MLPSEQLTAIKDCVSQLLELLDRSLTTSLTSEDSEAVKVAIQLAERVHSTLDPDSQVNRRSTAALCDDRR